MYASTVQQATTSPTTSTHRDLGQFGKDDFMNLLLAQLKNQDPLKPMDDAQFVSQLAQFSTLEKITEMSQQMGVMLDVEQLGQATALVGKSVEGTDPTSGETVKGVVDSAKMDDHVASVVVGGKTIPLSAVHDVTEEDSTRLLRATGLIGKEVEVNTGTTGGSSKGVVRSVKIVDGSPMLVMDTGTFGLSELASVDDPGSTQLTEATSLIGKKVIAYPSSGGTVSGLVDRIRMGDAGVEVSADGSWVKLTEVVSVAGDPNKTY